MDTLQDIRIPTPLRPAFGGRERRGRWLVRGGAILGLGALFALVAAVVYYTGGTQAAYVHLAYLPILLAASLFGLTGAIAAALVAGFVVAGPLMPIDAATGASQPLSSWLFRAGFFLLIGIAAGLLLGRLRRQLETLRLASLRHPVSGLPTQSALGMIIREVIAKGDRSQPQGLVTVDVKNYDQIFNTFGSEIVSHVPPALAQRLRPRFPLPWQIFHVHSGKVAIIVPETQETAYDQARDILRDLSEPVNVNGVPVYLDAVAGVATFDGDDSDEQLILQRSNIALADALRNDSALAHYDGVRSPVTKRTIQLLAEAPRGLEANEFSLVYQPQIRLADHHAVGSEALIRWQHPERGWLPPGEFIPLLEETGLINRLTRWVATEAIRQAAEWQRMGLEVTVSFNVSPRNIDDPLLFTLILDEIERWNLSGHRVEVEITESAIISDPKTLARHLAALKEKGVSIALDDFGDGFTSMRHLTTLPIDKLKIDRSLIDQVTTDSRRMRIVTAILSLAQDLGLHTTAEGIEDTATDRFLKQQGCGTAQGFLYSKPTDAGTMADWLQGEARSNA